jgi:phenylpyruvate tautomerase PptA (4-oxalocrotonate tautomerase family)
MPLLEIATNTNINNSREILEQASKLTAELLGKPESYVMVKLQPEQDLMFAGNSKPTAHVKLKSLGLPVDKTAEFSARICDFIHAQLDIESARIYIEFSNPERHMWGWDKRTF